MQQILPIRMQDLKGTKAFEWLRAAYEAKADVPKLVFKVSVKINDHVVNEDWEEEFGETIVHVERVIGYWSRTFKTAELRYSPRNEKP